MKIIHKISMVYLVVAAIVLVIAGPEVGKENPFIVSAVIVVSLLIVALLLKDLIFAALEKFYKKIP